VRADDVEGIRLHLHLGVVELVEGILDLLLVGSDHVLDRELDDHEHVVLGLGLDIGVELLHLKTHPAGHLLDKRGLALESGTGNANELPEALDDGAFLLLHREKEQGHKSSFGVSQPVAVGLVNVSPPGLPGDGVRRV